MTAHRFISSKINALRSAASPARGNAMAKEGHVNYDMSDVPVEARAAPTTGSGCATTCRQMIFFGGHVCENPWLSFVDDHCNKDQRMSVKGS